MEELVADILETQAERMPTKTFLRSNGVSITYREFNNRVSALADFFLNELGLGKLDRVLVSLPNGVEFFTAYFAIVKAGCIAVPVSSKLSGSRLRNIIADCEPQVLIGQNVNVGSDDLLGTSIGCIIRATGSNQSIHETFAGESNSASSFGASTYQLFNIVNRTIEARDFRRVIDIDPAMIIYSSGSTGQPKGIVCSHLNIVSASRSISEYLELKADDVILDVLPPFFDYGLYQAILGARRGAELVLAKDGIFADEVARVLDREGITVFPLVPTLAASLLRLIEIADGARLIERASQCVSTITNTGSTLHPKYITGLSQAFPNACIYPMYGLTECKRVSFLSPSLVNQRPYSVGKPMPNVEAWIVDSNGHRVSPGETGILVVRGSNVALGYWNDPVLTNETFRVGDMGERFLFTHDLFRQDEDGFLYFLGRDDDVIKSGGQRMSLLEIANIMLEIDGLSEVTVLAEPDEALGAVMHAFVVLSPGSTLSAKTIKKLMRGLVESATMLPRQIEIVAELPKTATGKVSRRALSSALSKEG